MRQRLSVTATFVTIEWQQEMPNRCHRICGSLFEGIAMCVCLYVW